MDDRTARYREISLYWYEAKWTYPRWKELREKWNKEKGAVCVGFLRFIVPFDFTNLYMVATFWHKHVQMIGVVSKPEIEISRACWSCGYLIQRSNTSKVHFLCSKRLSSESGWHDRLFNSWWTNTQNENRHTGWLLKLILGKLRRKKPWFVRLWWT